MDDDTLSRAPTAGCNSVAWILWRLTRVMDLFIHYRLQDAEQLWSKGGWAEKFNMQPGIYDQGGLDCGAGSGVDSTISQRYKRATITQ